MKVFIPWCGKQFGVQRVITNSKLPEAGPINLEAHRLGLPFVMDDIQTIPQPGDLWVGLCPANGYGDAVGECGEARTIEAEIVLNRLRNARPAVKRWVIEFHSGGFFQNLEAHSSGPIETAQTFDSKAATEAFMSMHDWKLFNGGAAKEVEVPAN